MDTSQQIQDRPKVKTKKSTLVSIIATWIVVLVAGMIAIVQLQNYIIDHRQSILYTDTYLSLEPFGKQTLQVPASQYPQYWWMNFSTNVSKTCQVSSDVVIRRRIIINNVEYLATTALNNSHVEGKAPASNGQVRHLTVSYDVYNINPWFKQPGNYEIQRISRFQCGNARVSNLTFSQVVKFQVTK